MYVKEFEFFYYILKRVYEYDNKFAYFRLSFPTNDSRRYYTRRLDISLDRLKVICDCLDVDFEKYIKTKKKIINLNTLNKNDSDYIYNLMCQKRKLRRCYNKLFKVISKKHKISGLFSDNDIPAVCSILTSLDHFKKNKNKKENVS